MDDGKDGVLSIPFQCEISGFRRRVGAGFALLGFTQRWLVIVNRRFGEKGYQY